MATLDATGRWARRRSSARALSDATGWLDRIERTLLAARDQPAIARRTVEAQITADHPIYERIDDVKLAVTEIATNALVHSDSRAIGAKLRLLLLVTRDGLRVCMRDAGGDGWPCITQAGADAVGGRGMALVDCLSDRWGFMSDWEGCVVWMDFGDCWTLGGEGITRW